MLTIIQYLNFNNNTTLDILVYGYGYKNSSIILSRVLFQNKKLDLILIK